MSYLYTQIVTIITPPVAQLVAAPNIFWLGSGYHVALEVFIRSKVLPLFEDLPLGEQLGHPAISLGLQQFSSF